MLPLDVFEHKMYNSPTVCWLRGKYPRTSSNDKKPR